MNVHHHRRPRRRRRLRLQARRVLKFFSFFFFFSFPSDLSSFKKRFYSHGEKKERTSIFTDKVTFVRFELENFLFNRETKERIFSFLPFSFF